ncbi:PIN domain-containing protein [Bifidobacterium tibiigranuli]|jgi:predicted nucleic acid-binding protein|uniref:PIN domain-containing protein n=1 Tax=Bifidobacterium tibiigranuli TaxID=2172043 RepID=UPI0023559684|nr:PIN domain-containing protein [Bifidobacterium tibiigranuli]MCI1211850.1 PIN domain-containing protein [Bifidobacterium tibiigranuli]MCI1221644.1 PIN domain-containing protein [Bifidobacterium tibiigranuli]
MKAAVLDANIFFHIWILDALLTVADDGLFEPLWSDEIMAEIRRNLPKAWKHATTAEIDAFLGTVNEAYPYAQVPDWRNHLDGLALPDPDDRHVLAAARAGGATIIVTINLADFPPKTLEKYGIRAEHPDTFLSRIYDESPEAVRHAITRMASRKRHPPRTMVEEYAGLKKAGLSAFAARLEA